jgi:hypothetical protein
MHKYILPPNPQWTAASEKISLMLDLLYFKCFISLFIHTYDIGTKKMTLLQRDLEKML